MTRVLMLGRRRILSHPGGDTVQMRKTAQALRPLGFEAEITDSLAPDFKRIDLVHCFGMMDPVEPILLRAAQAREAGLPVALSTVYWPWPGLKMQYYRRPASFLAAALLHHAGQAFNRSALYPAAGLAWALLRRRPWPYAVIRFRHGVMRWLHSQDSMRQRLLSMCQVILPNSYAELGVLKGKFENLPPHVIVPNAVDDLFVHAKPDWFERQFGRRDFVLCVGAINFRKNQLGLIRALGAGGKDLVLIGQGCGRYAELCRREAPRALFIPRLEGEQLASAYAAARVHALPSWYDTPGLASLEAFVSGCPVVVTEFGSTREYFGPLAAYCSPTDHASIRAALEKASAKRPSFALRREFQARFSWQEAAKATAAAYSMPFVHNY